MKLPYFPQILKKRFSQVANKNIHQIYQRIFEGGMPKLVLSNIDRERFYMDYVNTYLERDIKELAQVGKLSAFYDFLIFMAARTAQERKLPARLESPHRQLRNGCLF